MKLTEGKAIMEEHRQRGSRRSPGWRQVGEPGEEEREHRRYQNLRVLEGQAFRVMAAGKKMGISMDKKVTLGGCLLTSFGFQRPSWEL